ncbi:hypothetical protein DV736_g3436, partial [Chaetothyriales sp. CBS 134916]
MEDDSGDTASQNLLRPLSQPNLASRFPSLRRINSSEAYRHRSMPPESAQNAPGSNRNSSEVTFAVLYDDGPDYHVGQYDERGSMHSQRHRHDSEASFAPSFHTRDSRIISDDHFLERHPDYVANQRLLAEGYLSANDPSSDLSANRYRPSQSEDLSALQHAYINNEKRTVSLMSPTGQTNHSHESWCTCDEDHGHSMPVDTKDPTKFDLEAQNQMAKSGTPFLQDTKTPADYEVKFKGPNDPANPKAWPSKVKWGATIVTASFTFVSPLASSMIAPALKDISKEFHVTNTIEQQMVLSIFVLAYAIGPMFLGPLSELYGRVIVLQTSNLIFLAFNTACGFAQSKNQIMAFRFLSGIGGSAPLAIGGGVLGDLFKPEERGKAMGIYALGPLLGPAVGPIVGSWVAEYSTWRWIFWATSIADLFILGAGFWKLKESYAPFILHKKAKALRKQTGNNLYKAEGEGDLNQPVWKKVSATMARSLTMLFTQPIVQVMSVYMAFSYGVLYLGLSTMPLLFTAKPPDGYGQSLGISGLNYIALGLGFFIGAPVCGKSSDKIYHYFKKKDPRNLGKPEYRMPIVIPFSFLVPIGLLIYGWSANSLVFWLVPDIGLFFFGMGTIAAFQCVTTYLVDTYARFAASAVAAVTILRSLAGFGFPLFAPAMFKALGNGWGNTVLALAAVGIGVPVPILLWLFGEKLRKRSSLAMKPGEGPPGAMKGPGGPGGPPPSGPPPAFDGKSSGPRHG